MRLIENTADPVCRATELIRDYATKFPLDVNMIITVRRSSKGFVLERLCKSGCAVAQDKPTSAVTIACT